MGTKGFKLQVKIFTLLGFNFWDSNERGMKLVKWKWSSAVVILMLNSAFALRGTLQVEASLADRSATVVSALMSSLGAFKLVILALRTPEMVQLLKVLGSPEEREEKTQVERRARFLSDGFVVAAAGVVVAWSLYPAFTREMSLPFPYWLPLPIQEIHFFVCGYIVIVFFLIVIGLTNTAVDTTLLLLASRVCARLSRLRWEWEHLDFSLEDPIKMCIIEHIEILRLVRLLEKIVSGIFFFEVIECTLISCLTVFSVTQLDSGTEYFPKFIPIILGGYMMFFMYCWLGEQITTHCESLHFAIYSNNWYMANVKQRKSILIASTYAGVPFVITGGYIFTMTLKTFFSAVRESFSYYMVLKTLTT